MREGGGADMTMPKPCPFCGSLEGRWADHPEDCYLYMMADGECGLGPKPEYIKAWNRRVDSAAERCEHG
jgi:hypothetical protein